MKIIDIKQSPLNNRRWYLTLACSGDDGMHHGFWVTGDRRPRKKVATCPHGCVVEPSK